MGAIYLVAVCREQELNELRGQYDPRKGGHITVSPYVSGAIKL